MEDGLALKILRELGGDYGQGFYLGPPASEPLARQSIDTGEQGE